ncbi:MAG TPA: hypothetical protein DEB25_05590 [Desulfobulbaceae bacterium]|nr:hypothetical protein [Desulfobulbaceae bacterium]
MPAKTINYPLLVLVIAATVFCALAGLKRLDIDSDLSQSLPKDDPVIADALTIFQYHPIHDQVAIDLTVDGGPDVLARAGDALKERMRASRLFEEVGMESLAASLPKLRQDMIRQLPLLFSAEELSRQVAPLLAPAAIREKLTTSLNDAAGLSGIGQAETLAADPLGLHQLILAKLALLNPAPGSRLYQGHLLSEDGRHLLLVATTKAASSNTDAARQLRDFFQDAAKELDFPGLRLTAVGAWRAALDNETLIREDVELALTLSTGGIALLLLLAFPRPLFSLLSLVPPIAGTAAALFIYSLFHSSISVMVLGFAGALISVMDDFSITYLLFLDRKETTSGSQAASEMQSIGGALALFTTILSFAVLAMSDFPVFAALGEFTALGMACTFLFIHFICPRLLPEMPPSRRQSEPPLRRVSDRIFSRGGKSCLTACLFAVAMLAFARPQFHISLADMNSMTPETLAADRDFTKVWGRGEGKITLMAKAGSLTELQAENDKLQDLLTAADKQGVLSGGLSPSAFYPGVAVATRNFAAWQEFWTPDRIAAVRKTIGTTGARLGFSSHAFDTFTASIEQQTMPRPLPLSPAMATLLSFSQPDDGAARQFILATPGKNYDGKGFRAAYGQDGQGLMIFDGTYFAGRLGDMLFAAFGESFAIIAVVVSLSVFFALLDWRLTLIALAPMLFASICTLGTLHLLERPLDIPALMLVVVIFGLGIDFSIYLVCGYQYYGDGNHPNYHLLQSAMLLSATSTLIGFGALIFARHSVLHSIGVVSFCGLGYSLLGAILLLPPILTWHFRRKKAAIPTGTVNTRIQNRYRPLPAWPRMFAWGKLRGDSLFTELEAALTGWTSPRKIIDIGCGYGLPACWLLEHFPGSHIYACDPNPERVFFAQRAVAERGDMQVAAAPDLPQAFPSDCDLALLLDMAHYLDDEQLRQTFRRCRQLLHENGGLLVRFAIRPAGKPSLAWHFEDKRAKLAGLTTHYRLLEDMPATATAAGFSAVTIHPSAKTDMFWLVAKC